MANNRGQITLYVIVGVLLVAAIILLFLLFRGDIIEPVSPADLATNEFISQCVNEHVKDAVEIMLPNGGYIDITSKVKKMYRGANVTFLCYTINNYQKCINQDPMYIRSLENEITEFIAPEVAECFNSLSKDLKDNGYDSERKGYMEIKTKFFPGQIRVDIIQKFEMSGKGKAQEFEGFEVKTGSYLYDLASVAQKAVNGEALKCDFDYVRHMLLYPEFDITKDANSNDPEFEDIKIYTIKHKKTEEEIVFAIRSCALPPGFGR